MKVHASGTGILGGLSRLLKGDPAEATRKEYAPVVEAINKLAPQMAALDNDSLRAMTADLQKRAAAGESLNGLLPEAFAVCLPSDLLPFLPS